MRPHLVLLLGGLAAGVSVGLSGCADDGGSRAAAASAAAPATSATPTPAPSPPAPPADRWWSGDFHVHTAHSGDGVDTVAQTAGLARFVGLDFVALTDHSTLTQRGDPAFVPTPDLGLVGGYEWTDMVHLGLIGGRTVRPRLSGDPAAWPAYVQDLIDEVHAEGGLAIQYHPCWNTFPWLFAVERVDAVEVWNNLWTLSDTGLHPSDAADLQARLDGEGLTAAGVAPSAEIRQAIAAPGGGNDRALAYWEARLERGERVAAVGGSDRHKLLPPGYPTTWVLAPSAGEADLIAAVRAGRTIVTQGPDGPFVTFEADGDGDGVFEARIGDALAAGRPATLRVRIRGARDGLVRIVRRGRAAAQEVIASDDHTLTQTVTPASGDWFRVDAYHRVDWSLPAAGQVAQAAASPGAANVQALLSLWGVTVTTGTNYPAIVVHPDLRKLANLALLEPDWSRAAITSPIYAR